MRSVEQDARDLERLLHQIQENTHQLNLNRLALAKLLNGIIYDINKFIETYQEEHPIINKIALFIVFFLFVPPVFSQTMTGTLTFNHDGVNTTRYQLVVDGGAPVVVVPTTVTNQALCAVKPCNLSVPLPPLTVGIHPVTVSACNSSSICSTSAVLNIAIPISPSNLSVTITITLP